MKIELKNFKHAVFASEETLSLTASVYVDGTRMFTASNSGHGEENRIYPVEGMEVSDIRRVTDWIAGQKVKLEDDMEIDDNLDFYISRLASREVARKHLKPMLKRHVVIFDPEDNLGGLKQFGSSFRPTDMTDRHRDHLRKIYQGCLILNDLDIEQALDIYLAASGGGYPNADTVYQQIKAA
jgi:hypothetical protein